MISKNIKGKEYNIAPQLIMTKYEEKVLTTHFLQHIAYQSNENKI